MRGAKILRRELEDICLACGEQRGDDGAAFAVEQIAMSFGDFVNQAVGAEQAKESGGLAAATAFFFGVGTGSWEQQRSNVTVAESVDQELAARDVGQQSGVGLSQRVEGADGSALEVGAAAGHCRQGHD